MAEKSVTAEDWSKCVQHIVKEDFWEVEGLTDDGVGRVIIIRYHR
jgi:hypothetical protein